MTVRSRPSAVACARGGDQLVAHADFVQAGIALGEIAGAFVGALVSRGPSIGPRIGDGGAGLLDAEMAEFVGEDLDGAFWGAEAVGCDVQIAGFHDGQIASRNIGIILTETRRGTYLPRTSIVANRIGPHVGFDYFRTIDKSQRLRRNIVCTKPIGLSS